MRAALAVLAALAAAGLGADVAHAQLPLPAASDVATPTGEVIHVAVPPETCSYPKEVRDRAARFLSEGKPGLRLLGAAGDCASMGHLVQGETGLISHSFQMTMLSDLVDPAKRPTPLDYRRQCFEQYPKKKEETAADTLREDLERADGQLKLGEAMSLGLLASTRDAVFGGSLTEVARAPRRVILVQVTACFAPSGVPVLWMFQDAVDRGAGLDEFNQAARRVLDLAMAQVEATVALNQAATPRP